MTHKHHPPAHPRLYMYGQPVAEVEHHKHLGLYLSRNLRWHQHVDYIVSKAYQRINLMRKYKFILDRNTLEAIYLSFVRPILEYGDVVFDNCTDQELNELERVQHEAARVVTGTTKLVSIDKLMHEVKWDSLKERRRKHKLILLYKIIHGHTPQYLTALLPPSVHENTSYNLRNANNIQLPRARTGTYQNSFMPSAIREFNALDDCIKNAPSLSIFKRSINKNVHIVPKYFNYGDRKSQIIHARLRTNCSALAADLYSKNIVNSNECLCGQPESVYHYFLVCPQYNAYRTALFSDISHICPISLPILLHGDPSLSLTCNISIFTAVHTYIKNSKRFGS